MKSLIEVLHASLALHNLPFTVLLVLATGYWMLVCVGFLDHETADAALEVDGGVDASLDGSLDGPADVGLLHGVLKFLHAGEAPIMAIVSVLILCAWSFSVLANHYLNPDGGLLLAGALLIPNLVISALLTRVLTKPLRLVFKALNKDYDRAEPVIGRVCEVSTSEVTATFGQATLETRGAPLTLQVRTAGEVRLQRGERALIIGEDREQRLFQVVKYQEPKTEE